VNSTDRLRAHAFQGWCVSPERAAEGMAISVMPFDLLERARTDFLDRMGK